MTLDANFVQGNDITLEFTVTDEDGAALDITGATVKWSLKRAIGETADLTKQTGGSGITLTDADGGVFEVELTDTDTAALYGEYVHEAVIIDALGKVRTVTESDSGFGKLTIRKRITSAA